MVEAGEEEKSKSNPPKLNSSTMCEECKENPWKYKCPGCSIRSCSLPCVKSHKQRTSCTGKRPRTEIVPISQFDDTLLISDYKFLEEAKRVKESAQRRRLNGAAGGHLKVVNLPYKIKELRAAAWRRKIQLLYLPIGMSKRENNKTLYKKNSIFWTIEWRFHSTDVVIVDNGVDEDTKLSPVFEKHLKPGPWKDKLRPFCEAQLDCLKFFIRKNATGPKSPYLELDINSPIRQQLAKTLIVEYPVIHVFLPSASFDFEVISLPPRPPKLSETNFPSPQGVPFKEEEVDDEEEPQILELMKCVNSEPTLKGEAAEDTDEFFFSNISDLELPENSDFNFEQDLRDAYTGLIGEINPDDFLDLDGGFLQGFDEDEELEEGEIPG